MVLVGKIREGEIVLNDPIPLPEGTTVEVQVAVRSASGAIDRTLLDVLGPFVGQAQDLPPDTAQNIDHYLYGHPKS